MKTRRHPFLFALALLLVLETPDRIQAQTLTENSKNVSISITLPPNIIIFIGDDIAWNDIGAYGHPHVQTPNIDRLASEGIKFTSAFLTTSQCSPTRASILTGKYPHNTGAQNLHDPLPAGEITIPELLRNAGYFTASVGKWHLGDAARTKFDVIIEGNAINHGLNVLRQRPENRPFFLWFASWDAHWPYQENTIAGPHEPDDVVIPPFIPALPGVIRDFTMYYDEISRFDEHIGLVIDELIRQDIFDQTIIIFISDNGRPFPRSKSFLYDSGIKMPLIIRYPRLIEANTSSNSLISALDIAPTVTELANIDQPESFQGKSLKKLFIQQDTKLHEAVFAEHNWHAFQAHERCIRTNDYLYIRNAFPELPGLISRDYLWHSKGYKEMISLYKEGKLDQKFDFYFKPVRPKEELFDLASDPWLMKNVIDNETYMSIADSMRDLLDKWIKDTHDTIPVNPKPDWFDRWDGSEIPHD